jgi:ABC-type nitrate/sulfonate/bicarbonate transport system substrate-binding protein
LTGTRRRFDVTLIAVMLLVLTACGGSDPSGGGGGGSDDDETTIFLGTGTTEAEAYMVPFLTIGREILAEEGYSVEYVVLSSDEAVQAALDRGRVDVAVQSSLGLQRARSAGLTGQFITGLQQHNSFVLVVPADVTDLSQLEGMRVGIEDPTSLSVTVAEVLIREQGGLEPGDDYEMVPLSGSSNRAAAMESGSLDAAVLFRAVGADLEAGGDFRIHGGLWDVLDPMLWEGIAASDEFMENTELAEIFARAMMETNEQFYAGDPAELAARKDEHPETELLDLEGLIGDFELWQEIELFPTDGGVTQEAYDGITQFLLDAGQLTEETTVSYEDAVNPSFVEAVSE